MADFTVTVDWGARSEALRSLHAKRGAVRSFLLAKAPLPVALGTMKVTDTGVAWDLAPVSALTVTPVAGASKATIVVPEATKDLRLDFDLRVTIGGQTATCLEFRQIFAVGAGGSLLPRQYSVEDITWTRAASSGGAAPPTRGKGSAAGGRRAFMGTCPLLRVGVGRLEINCEFLDVTELWWAHWAKGDRWGWYLDPDLGGRPELLRVLAWTSGVAPMIWFVALSDRASTGAPSSKMGDGGKGEAPKAEEAKPAANGGGAAARTTGADLVFFRPLAGLNSFVYTPDESGFLAQKHGDTTVWNLARWLLPPLQFAKLKAKRTKMAGATVPFMVDYASMRLIPATPPPKIDPTDPIDRVQQDVTWAFRLVGLEAALSRSPAADVVFLPLSFDATPGYDALTVKDALRDVVQSARALLWVRRAFGQDQKATPTFDRQLWIAGHSAANLQMFMCLANNARDVDRIISYDATPADKLLLPSGIPAVTSAAKTRAALGKALKAVFVTTPNMWSDKAAYQAIEKKIVGTKADVTMLPPDAEWDDYWKHPPTATSNPHLFEVLREWDGNGLSMSVRFGKLPGTPPDKKRFQWLFWHEWAVHGGHVVLDTATPPAVDHVRTFFEDVLKMP